MALPHKDSSPIFADAATGTLRLIVYLALACVLIVLDHRNGWLHRARYATSLAVEPIYRAAAWPGETAQNLRTAFTSHRDLVSENRHLREALLLAQARLNR